MKSVEYPDEEFNKIRQEIQRSNWNASKDTKLKNAFLNEPIQSLGKCWTGDVTTKLEVDISIFTSQLSCKLFLGGVSWYTSDNDIIQRFLPFGLRHVELPSRNNNNNTNQPQAVASLGFAYLIFENGECVKQLLAECWRRQMKPDNLLDRKTFYIDLPSSHGSKPVEVIPWALDDNNYFRPGVIPPLDPKRTVFIGNLHGTVRASELALLVEQIFHCSVEYAGIDVDKYKYPIGSGRVTFQRGADYTAAIGTAFVDVRTSRFQKRIQIDPYLEDVICPKCKRKDGSYFCRTCFEYFCISCWVNFHQNIMPPHPKPLARRQKRFPREIQQQQYFE